MNIPARFQSKAQEEITESYQRTCDPVGVSDPDGLYKYLKGIVQFHLLDLTNNDRMLH